MRIYLIFFISYMLSYGMAQTQDGKAIPQVTHLPVEDGTVTVLHLMPGYTTSLRLPEEISSVVVGNPAAFKAEHSEAEPRLVFLKPIATQAAESNALITTKSGHEINVQLISEGREAAASRVDFLVEFRRPQGFMAGASEPSTFLIPETNRLMPLNQAAFRQTQPSLTSKLLAEQEEVTLPVWEGKELLVALGHNAEAGDQMIVAFSLLNRSKSTIELVPPQIELSGSRGRLIKAEPIPVADFHMTVRRLEPGERADGVVVFTRPAFKEADEKLLLRLADAERIDRPIVVPLPFTAAMPEVLHEAK